MTQELNLQLDDLEKEIDFTYFELEDMRESLPYNTFKIFEAFMLEHIQTLTAQLIELQGG